MLMYKDFGTSGIGRCERSPRHCGPTNTGQIEASGHQLFVDPRESSQGALNFKKVAGVDNGADLLTKTFSWNEIQSPHPQIELIVCPR